MMKKAEIVAVCRDYVNPDEDLLKNLDKITDSGELISIRRRTKSLFGRSEVIARMKFLTRDGFGDDANFCSLRNRQLLAQSASDGEFEKLIAEKMDKITLTGLEEDEDLDSLKRKAKECVSNHNQQRVKKRLNEVFQKGLKDEDNTEHLEEMLSITVFSLSRDVLRIRIDELKGILDGLGDDKDEQSLFGRLERSRSSDAEIKIKERIDEVRGVFERIGSCDFEELIGLHGFALSGEAISSIRDRMNRLIMEIDSADPPEWFATLLKSTTEHPLGCLDGRVIKDKAREIMGRN